MLISVLLSLSGAVLECTGSASPVQSSLATNFAGQDAVAACEYDLLMPKTQPNCYWNHPRRMHTAEM